MTSGTKTTTTAKDASPAKSSRGASVNRVTLVGRLVATPELRETSNGIHVTTIRVATNDQAGEPTFHSVVLWRQLADFATTYLTKGRLVYIEGRLHSRTWEATDGTQRRTVEVVASQLKALSSKNAEASTAA